MIIYSYVGVQKIDDRYLRQMSYNTPWKIESLTAVTPRLRERIMGYALLTWAASMEGARRYNNSEAYGFPQIQYNQYGKPHMLNEDVVFYNISHCTEELCLVMSDQEVGIDIEKVDRMTDKVMDYFLNSAEILKAQESEQSRTLGCMYWTKKESYCKYLGNGIRKSMKDILVDVPEDVAFHSYWHKERTRVITVCGKAQDQEPEKVIGVELGQLIGIMC